MWKLLKVETETEPKCWHCQTNIKYACWIENKETGETICVGRSCCENFLSRSGLKSVDAKCKTLLKVAKVQKRIKALNTTISERARIASLLIGNMQLLEKHFSEEYAYLIK